MRSLGAFFLLLLLGPQTSVASTGDIARPPVRMAVRGSAEFGLDLYARLTRTEGNVVFSPFSISAALAMTWAGAKGRTDAEMRQVLHFDGIPDSVHAAYGSLLRMLAARADNSRYQLGVVNRLWGQSGERWLDPFLRTTREVYGAELTQMDFAGSPNSSAMIINRAIEEQTHHKITHLLHTGDIDDLTRLVLTDAVYFKGTWETRFLANDTKPRAFWTTPSESVQVQMMGDLRWTGYAHLTGLQVLEMPYAGRDLSMFVLLPDDKDGLASLERRLSADSLDAWLSRVYDTKVQTEIPRFRVSDRFELKDHLGEMGMPCAFEEKCADFSGMSGPGPLRIANVIHETFIRVDEDGTEAAGSHRSGDEDLGEYQAARPRNSAALLRRSSVPLPDPSEFLRRRSLPGAGDESGA